MTVALLAAPARAFDPRTEWSTLEAGVVRVHYPEGHYGAALVVARGAHESLAELSTRLGWKPKGPIEIVLNDETDGANGKAMAVPYNQTILNLVAPEEVSELAAYDDWLFSLATHELSHVVHTDTVRGVPGLINEVFGRLYFPNSSQPRWFLEGLATYFESTLTSAGRVDSSYFDMVLRSAVLEGEPATLDDITGAPRQWPQGSHAYVYGSYFIDYLARRFGEDALRQLSYDYAGRLIPWAMNLSARRVTGHDYATLYEDFLSQIALRFADQRDAIVAAGLVEGERLTARGQHIGPARVSKDGRVYFVETPISDRTYLRVLDGAGDEEISFVEPDTTLALFPDGKRAVISQNELINDYKEYRDLFVVDLESGRQDRLTTGARAQSPDVAPDGDRLAFVQVEGSHGVVRLARVSAPTEVRTVADLGEGTQVWSPRFSPDGARLAFSGFAEGYRDLFVVDIASGAVARLTHDAALDGSPAFSPDGAWLYFHSDRDGVFNLYALELAHPENVRRVTRVLGGAFRPEATAERIVYQGYGPDGFDLFSLPAADPHGLPAAEPPRPAPPRGFARHRVQAFPSHPYDGSETIRPRAWLPAMGYDARGFYVGAAVSGQDVLGLHAYNLAANYEALSSFVSLSAAYANRQFHPGVTFTGSRLLSYAAFPYVRNGVATAVQEEVWAGSLSTIWPLLTRRQYTLGLSTAYELEVRSSQTDLVVHPLDQTPAFPDHGRFAAARLGLVFGHIERYVDSISAERGGQVSLSLRLEDPYLGSEYSSVSAAFEAAGFLQNPWLDRHVLATRLFLGYGDSSYRQRRLFAIAGLSTRDVLLDGLRGRMGAPPALRGFPAVPFVGDALLAGTAEYRLPIFDLDKGTSTLPFYARGLHAAAFADGAFMSDTLGTLLGEPHVSVGAELRLGVLLAYSIPATVRFGYGRGLLSDRVQALYAVLDSEI